MSFNQREHSEMLRDRSKFELSETQAHFEFSNEMLINGIPASRWYLLNTPLPKVEFASCGGCKEQVEIATECCGKIVNEN